MPTRNFTSIRESGKQANEANGVKFLRHEEGAAVFALGSGNYEFTSQ